MWRNPQIRFLFAIAPDVGITFWADPILFYDFYLIAYKVPIAFNRAGYAKAMTLFGVIVFEVWESPFDGGTADASIGVLCDAPGADW